MNRTLKKRILKLIIILTFLISIMTVRIKFSNTITIKFSWNDYFNPSIVIDKKVEKSVDVLEIGSRSELEVGRSQNVNTDMNLLVELNKQVELAKNLALKNVKMPAISATLRNTFVPTTKQPIQAPSITDANPKIQDQPKNLNYLYTGRNWSVEKLKFNKPPVKMITIRGERHSGTGWLRTMISQNCPDLEFKIREIDNPNYVERKGSMDIEIQPQVQTVDKFEKHWPGQAQRQNLHQNIPNHRRLPPRPPPQPKTIWLDADGIYGWKHSLIPSNFSLNNTDFLIILFRDIKTWLPKMREVTYEKIPRNNLPMLTFLNTKWQPKNEHSWEDVFEMRSGKYRNWLEYRVVLD